MVVPADVDIALDEICWSRGLNRLLPLFGSTLGNISEEHAPATFLLHDAWQQRPKCVVDSPQPRCNDPPGGDQEQDPSGCHTAVERSDLRPVDVDRRTHNWINDDSDGRANEEQHCRRLGICHLYPQSVAIQQLRERLVSFPFGLGRLPETLLRGAVQPISSFGRG